MKRVRTLGERFVWLSRMDERSPWAKFVLLAFVILTVLLAVSYEYLILLVIVP